MVNTAAQKSEKKPVANLGQGFLYEYTPTHLDEPPAYFGYKRL